jgi:4-amino-4-deoxy-L-arabinose transferase-like glycosyltransferase
VSDGRAIDRWVAASLAAWTLMLAAWLLLSGASVTREDGYYYLQIARNAAEGRGSTFDGVTRTNGYHPLWVLTLVPVLWAFPETDAGQRAAVALQALLLAAGVVVLYRLLRRHAGRLPAALGAALWLAVVFRAGVSGLEFALHALLVMGAAWVYAQRSSGRAGPRANLLLGVLLALAFLARLENAALAAVVVAA